MRATMRLLVAVTAVLVAAAALTEARGGIVREQEVVIDGKETTIGLTAAKYFAGEIPQPFGSVIDIIVNVLTPSTPEEDIDYFGLIKENVETVVGEYINALNMEQLEVYKDDLAVLMKRYSEAPVESDTYPDKNTMANSLSTSIVANRFLIEAVEWPHSMMLHYADIASIHIMVLQDAAETYSAPEAVPSYWWVDLDQQLEHYITYGRALEDTVVDWRNDLVECTFSSCVYERLNAEGQRVCYDVWTVVDQVADLTDTCTALQGDTSCDDHCQAYQVNMNREVAMFVYKYLGRVMTQWEDLKMLSSMMAAIVIGGGSS